MALNSENTVVVSFCIGVVDFARLITYCENHHVTRSAVLRSCVNEFLSNKKTDKKF